MAVKSNDFDIRAAIVASLLEDGVERKCIRHEITLDSSSSGGRADLVILTRNVLGIEIKSGRDRLDRLKEQFRRYERAFDHAAVVVDQTKEKRLGYARNSTIWDHDRKAFVRTWQNSFARPDRYCFSRHTSIVDMARLMWRDEAVDVAWALGERCGTRERAISWMRENATLASMRPLVIRKLRERAPNRWEEAFWQRFDRLKAA